MRKLFSRVFLLTAAVVMMTEFFSCQNFLSGSDLKEEMSEIIADLHASEIPILFVTDEGTGTITSNKNILKVGRELSFIYKVNSNVKFEYWIIKEEGEITTDVAEVKKDEADEKDEKYILKFLREPKRVTDKKTGEERYAEIVITPSYKMRPVARTITPVNEPNGISRDRAIFLEFTKDIEEESFIFSTDEIPADVAEEDIFKNEDEEIFAYRLNGETFFKNIEITNSMKESLVEHFKEPKVDGKSLTIEVDKINPILINSGSYEMIDVTVKKDVTDTEGVSLPEDINWHYKIIEATDEKATIYTEAETINGVVSGTVPAEQKIRECNINQKITLDFTENAGFQFFKWEYDEKIVSLENPRSKTTTAIVLNATKNIVSGEDKPSTIKAICKPKLKVVGVEPSDNQLVSKNSSISIKFNNNIPNDEEGKKALNGIMISMGSVSIKDCFNEPEIVNDTVIFTARNDNMIDVPAGETKSVVITLPSSLYYKAEDGTKITLDESTDSYKYKIDNSTVEKTKVLFSTSTGSGKIYADDTDMSLIAGGNEYSIGQTVSLRYEANEGYQFNGWEVLAGGTVVDANKIKIADTKAKETTLTVKELLNTVTVNAKASAFLTASSEIENTKVAKNKDIVIVFSKEISTKNDLSKIQIAADGTRVDKNFSDRQLNGKTLTIKNTKRLEVEKDKTKEITVLIPKEFYYEDNGTKITLKEDRIINYTVDHTTMEKVLVKFALVDGETRNPIPLAGTLTPNQAKDYYLDEEFDVDFKINDGYYFAGYKYIDKNGDVISKSILDVKNISDYSNTLTFNEVTQECNVTVVCYKRPSISSKSPDVEARVNENNIGIEINFNHKIEDVCKDMIKVSYDGDESFVKDDYFSSSINGEGTKITLARKPNTWLPVGTSGVQKVTVTVPGDIYYLANDYLDAEKTIKIEAGSEAEYYKWTYKIDNSTLTKTKIKFETENGTVYANGETVASVVSLEKEYNENSTVIIKYAPNENHEFTRWTIEGLQEGFEVSSGNKCIVTYNGEEYLVIDDITLDETTLHVKKTIPNAITIKNSEKENLVIKNVYVEGNSNVPLYMPSGYACDSKLVIEFNKDLDEDSICLTQVNSQNLNSNDGTINIVSGTNNSLHLEEYFSAQVQGNTIILSPDVMNYKNGKPDCLKIKDLVEEKTDVFDLMLIIYPDGETAGSRKIVDTEGNTIKAETSGTNKTITWFYRINGYQEENKPKIKGISIEAKKYNINKDEYYHTNIPIIKEESELDTQKIEEIHVGEKIKLSFTANDTDSGIKEIRCVERVIKSSSGASIPNHYYTHTLYKATSILKEVNYEAELSSQTEKDGLVTLEFEVEDFAGNVQKEKCLIIKDTVIDSTLVLANGDTFILTATRNYYYNTTTSEIEEDTENTFYGSSERVKIYYELFLSNYYTGNDEVKKDIRNSDQGYCLENYRLSDDNFIVLDFNFIKDNYYPIEYGIERINKPNFKIDVFYKNNKYEDFPEESNAIIETVDNIKCFLSSDSTEPILISKKYYKIPRSDKNQYIKIVCTDEIGNTTSIEKAIPGVMNITYFQYKEGTQKYIEPNYEKLDDFKITAKENGATFDVLFYFTYQENAESEETNPRVNDYLINGFLNNTSARMTFTRTNLPDEIYRPDGIYNLYFIPMYEYPDGSRYYGKTTKYVYNWVSSTPQDFHYNNAHIGDDFPPSFEVELEPIERSKGTRTIKVTLPPKSEGWDIDTEYLYGIKCFPHDGTGGANVYNITVLDMYFPFNVDVSKEEEIIDYFELQSGKYYDICLYQKSKGNSSTPCIYLSKNFTVTNVDLTEDNRGPKLNESNIDGYMHQYINYPNFLRIGKFGTNYNLIPTDDGYGLLDFAAPTDYEDAEIDIPDDEKDYFCYKTFKYYLIRKENETWDNPNYTIEWLDENLEPEYKDIKYKYNAEKIGHPMDKYEPDYNDFADIDISDLPEGYYTLVLRFMDNRINPEFLAEDPDNPEIYWYEEYHEPNESLYTFSFSTILDKRSESSFYLSGSSYRSSEYAAVDKLDVSTNNDAAGKWNYIGLASSYSFINSSTGAKFLRAHASTQRGSKVYAYVYRCPAYDVYKQSHSSFRLNSKNILVTDTACQVFCDGPIIVQVVSSKNDLSKEWKEQKESNSSLSEAAYWLSKGNLENYNKAKLYNYDDNVENWKNTSLSFKILQTYDNKYYASIFTFADGTSLLYKGKVEY